MSLLNTLDTVKSKLKPLPQHYLVDQVDTYVCQQYATLLAAIMLNNGSSSCYQNQLFIRMLDSLQLEAQPSSYLDASQQMDTAKVIELMDHLDKSGHINLLFDAILLLRIDNPLTPDEVRLINALIDVFEISENNVLMTVFWANKALGIDANLDKKHQDKLHQLTVSEEISLYTDEGFQLLCHQDSFVRKGDILFHGVMDKMSYNIIKNSFFNFSGSHSYVMEDLLSKISEETGWVVRADEKLSEHRTISYSLLPLLFALSHWAEFYAEIYSN